jgi:hypothetical protein
MVCHAGDVPRGILPVPEHGQDGRGTFAGQSPPGALLPKGLLPSGRYLCGSLGNPVHPGYPCPKCLRGQELSAISFQLLAKDPVGQHPERHGLWLRH